MSHPFLILCVSPNSSIFFLPKQNLSIISYNSYGFCVNPISGSSSTITSVSMLAWIKWESLAFFTSPFNPTKQCSFTLWKSWLELAFFALLYLFFLLVLSQTISSHLLNPHFLKSSLPLSRFCVPTHKNKKEGVSEISSIYNSPISSKLQLWNFCGFCW